jgi:hypothetical protein
MSIFYAIAHLIELVTNMAKPPPKESSGSDINTGSQDSGGAGNKSTPTCPPKLPKSSTKQSKEDDSGDGDDMGMGDFLPEMNLNGGEEEEGENEPGKTFIEILFSFVLDPLTAIIKGIIKMVELAIITVNIAMHLGKCSKWFVIYVFCTLVYIPISMLFALLNLAALEKKIWKTLGAVDAALFCVIAKVRGEGFHITRFSDDIRSVCFLETVKPTDCSSKTSNKNKKSKSFNLASLLGSQLFLFLVILFICGLFFMLGTNKGVAITNIPFSFLVLFVIIVLIMVIIVVATFTNYIIYLFFVLILPIVVFVLSFFFGHIPYYLFDEWFKKELVKKEKPMFQAIAPLLFNFTYMFYSSVNLFQGIYAFTMGKINPLPNFVQYLIAMACIFVTLIMIMIIIALSTMPPSNDENSPYMTFVNSVQSAFSSDSD